MRTALKVCLWTGVAITGVGAYHLLTSANRGAHPAYKIVHHNRRPYWADGIEYRLERGQWVKDSGPDRCTPDKDLIDSEGDYPEVCKLTADDATAADLWEARGEPRQPASTHVRRPNPQTLVGRTTPAANRNKLYWLNGVAYARVGKGQWVVMGASWACKHPAPDSGGHFYAFVCYLPDDKSSEADAWYNAGEPEQPISARTLADGTLAPEPKGSVPPPLPRVYNKEVTEAEFAHAYVLVNRSNPDLADFSDEQLAKMGGTSFQSRMMCFNFICKDDPFGIDVYGYRAAVYIERHRSEDNQ